MSWDCLSVEVVVMFGDLAEHERVEFDVRFCMEQIGLRTAEQDRARALRNHNRRMASDPDYVAARRKANRERMARRRADPIHAESIRRANRERMARVRRAV